MTMDERIMKWVHEDETNRKKVCNRALFVAMSPLLIPTIIFSIILLVL